jgi:hypothetical protein
MLSLTGTIRAATTLPGTVNKKTGEAYPSRNVLQIEGTDSRGLVQVYTLSIPHLEPYVDQVGKTVSVPVRAWAPGATVQLSFADGAQG